MKAAVLHEVGGVPKYEDFADPVAGEGEVVLEVRAVAVENVDKMIAAGQHYASNAYVARLPMIPGFDGVGALPDGTLVGFANPVPPYGALAERTVVTTGNLAPIPEGLDPVAAVTLASAMPAMCLRTAAGLTAGETVLIQGATGVAGRLAVKVARLLGAGRIVATGRDDQALSEVAALGADAVINTAVSDAELCAAFTRAAPDGYDVVLDFLWGRPTELLLRTLVPESFTLAAPTRLIQAGESAGPAITLPAASMRTSGVEIYGAGKGADRQSIGASYRQVVGWATTGELTFDVEPVTLGEIESAWQHPAPRGKRLVVQP
ncbi:zinc-binding alcohol dehydrogenase family protein [Nocardia sp. CA2R105]|uniref:quinone oxidoreductase family protein n=1 Tax=Nocardia coffeae TaxID=2873381 RepID=UPI001CA7023F|nr:zinc-binding alcohol dehydrogenase family protein [Nocardia coffeae]MBY8861636.1 zinc-binding alcohol dehydrogenase family protein [Nocardia coffeae]